MWSSVIIVMHALVRAASAASRTRREPLFCIILVVSMIQRMAAWTFSAVAHSFSSHASASTIELVWRLDYTGVYLTLMELQPTAPVPVWAASLSSSQD